MKKFYILIGVLAGIAVAMLACKKDSEPVADSANPNPPETQAVLDRVNAFRSQIEYYKANPAVKDGETENIDDAIWDIEALFNFTYAYPELSYSRTVSYDTTLYLPVNDKQVLLTDLAVFYGQMYEAISDLYHKTELSDKQFLILDVEAGELHGNTLAMKLHSVQGSVRNNSNNIPDMPQHWPGPFVEGEWWWYGENGGGFNGYSNSDAAQELTKWLRFYLIPSPPENYTYAYTNIKEAHTNLNSVRYYRFHDSQYDVLDKYADFYIEGHPFVDSDSLVLNRDQLNFHFFGERHIVLHELRTVWSIPTSHVLSYIEIKDGRQTDGREYRKIWHETSAKYGVRHLMLLKDINKIDL